MMKNNKSLVIAFAILTMSLVACSSDDNIIIEDGNAEEIWREDIQEVELYGVWSRIEATISVEGQVIDQIAFDSEVQCEAGYLQIYSDYSMSQHIPDWSYDTPYCMTTSYSSTWSLDANILSWVDIFEEGTSDDYITSNTVYIKENLLKTIEKRIVDEDFIEYEQEDYEYTFVLGETYFVEIIYEKIESDAVIWQDRFEEAVLLGVWRLNKTSLFSGNNALKTLEFDKAACDFDFLEIQAYNELQITSWFSNTNGDCAMYLQDKSWELKYDNIFYIGEYNEGDFFQSHSYAVYMQGKTMKMVNSFVVDAAFIKANQDIDYAFTIGEVLFSEMLYLRQ